MAKIPQYDPITAKRDPELDSMLQDFRNFWNRGRYNPEIETTIPSTTGEEGQEKLYHTGNLVRRYHYLNGNWHGIPLSVEVGWGFIQVTAAASATASLTFGTAFATVPMVMVTPIGFKVTDPDTPDDLDNTKTLISWAAYAPSTSSCTVAVYTGNGSNMTNADRQGFAYLAVAVGGVATVV